MKFLKEEFQSFLHDTANNTNGADNLKNGLNELYAQVQTYVFAIGGGIAAFIALAAIIWTFVNLYRMGKSDTSEERAKYKKTIGWVWLGFLIAIILFAIASVVITLLRNQFGG